MGLDTTIFIFFLVPYKIFYYSIFDQATMKDTLYNDYIGTKYI